MRHVLSRRTHRRPDAVQGWSRVNVWTEYAVRVLAVGALVMAGILASYWSVAHFGTEGGAFAFVIGYVLRPWCEALMDTGEAEQ